MGVQVVSVIPMKVAAQRIRFNRESAYKWKQIGCLKIQCKNWSIYIYRVREPQLASRLFLSEILCGISLTQDDGDIQAGLDHTLSCERTLCHDPRTREHALAVSIVCYRRNQATLLISFYLSSSQQYLGRPAHHLKVFFPSYQRKKARFMYHAYTPACFS